MPPAILVNKDAAVTKLSHYGRLDREPQGNSGWKHPSFKPPAQAIKLTSGRESTGSWPRAAEAQIKKTS